MMSIDNAVRGTDTSVVTTIAIEPSGDQTVVDVREVRRQPQVHARGRWRSKKRVLAEFVAELGYPGCLKVTTMWNLEGIAVSAGIRLRDFHKACGRARQHPGEAQRSRARDRAARRESKRMVARGELPF